MVVLILAVALVIDGGNALLQRRASQNASDFAALAGARIIATWIDNDAVNGTDANVVSAIDATIAANGGTPVTYGSPNGPRYVSRAGASTGWVGAGTIPTAPRASRSARAGRSGRTCSGSSAVVPGRPVPPPRPGAATRLAPPIGNVFPAGISLAFFETYPFCTGDVGSSPECQPQHLTPGNLNVPGGIRWLKFGATGQCAGFGLGMSTTSGCDNSKPFLQEEDRATVRTASAVALPSRAIRTSTGSEACPATRPAPIAPTTSTTRSS